MFERGGGGGGKKKNGGGKEKNFGLFKTQNLLFDGLFSAVKTKREKFF